jgi:hypothetical protein
MQTPVAAVAGFNFNYSGTSYGVHGDGLTIGVRGDSPGTGVAAYSSAGTGLYAESTSGLYAIYATGPNTAIYGTTDSGYAVSGVATNASAGFGVYGKSNAYAVFSDGALFVNSDSTVKASGSGTWTISSDARIKTDVADYQDGLAELEKVRTVKFRYNGLAGTDTSRKEYVGVIAQELEKVAPYMISARKAKLRDTDREPSDIKQVDPGAFTFMLINAVKELARENRKLAEDNAEMQRMLCASHPKDSFCRQKVASRN